MHATTTTDSYGQISKISFSLYELFGSDAEKVLDFIKHDKSLITASLVSNQYFSYQAVTIVSDSLRKKCSEALQSNQHYIHNVNRRW